MRLVQRMFWEDKEKLPVLQQKISFEMLRRVSMMGNCEIEVERQANI